MLPVIITIVVVGLIITATSLGVKHHRRKEKNAQARILAHRMVAISNAKSAADPTARREGAGARGATDGHDGGSSAGQGLPKKPEEAALIGEMEGQGRLPEVEGGRETMRWVGPGGFSPVERHELRA